MKYGSLTETYRNVAAALQLRPYIDLLPDLYVFYSKWCRQSSYIMFIVKNIYKVRFSVI